MFSVRQIQKKKNDRKKKGLRIPVPVRYFIKGAQGCNTIVLSLTPFQGSLKHYSIHYF